MERQIGKRPGGWAVFAAGLLALALVACSDGSSLGGLITTPVDNTGGAVTPEPTGGPEPIAEPLAEPVPTPPSDKAEAMTIKRGFAISVDPSSSIVGREIEVTVSTTDFEPSDPAKLTDEMVKEVVVKFGGEEVDSTVEMGPSATDAQRAEIRATFMIPRDAAEGMKKVVLKINGVASAPKDFQVSVLNIAETPPLIGRVQDAQVQTAGISRMSLTSAQQEGTDKPMSIAAGKNHTCVTKGNRIYCWGSSEKRQLGDGELEHACTSDEDYESACNTFSVNPIVVQYKRQTPFDANGVTKLAAGANHTCALKEDGTVWCWGDNSYGQLGGGFKRGNNNLPKCIGNAGGAVPVIVDDTFLPGQTQPADPLPERHLTGIVDIAASGDRTCALDREGKLYCWGYRRQLYRYRSTGLTESVCAAVRATIPVFSGSAGKIEELALSSHIWVRLEGQNTVLPLEPESTNNPAQYQWAQYTVRPSGYSKLASTGNVLCAIDGQDKASCWSGQQTVIAPPTEVDSVYVGQGSDLWSFSVCVVYSQEDQLLCRRVFSNSNDWSPVKADNDMIKDVASVAVGPEYVCYVDDGNTVHCGGRNCSKGQCGMRDGAGDTSMHEVRIP